MSFNLDGYTDNQKDAIITTNSNLLVTASAGSGKTRVLVTRVSYILHEKLANINEILVMTFTNLASIEMKQRIKQDIEKLASNDEHFINQLQKLNTADIFTIHKFCQKVIKEYFYQTATDPNFTILDDNKAQFLIDESITEAISNEIENDNKRFVKLYKLFNEKRNDVVFRQECVKLLNFLKSKQSYNSFIEKFLKNTYNNNLEENEIIRYYNLFIDDCMSYYKDIFNTLKIDAESLNIGKLVTILDKYLEFIGKIENKTFSQRVEIFNGEFNFERLDIRKLDAEQEELKNNAKLVINNFKNDILSIKKVICFSSATEIQNNIYNDRELIEEFVSFVLKIDNIYAQKKTKINVLDFNDLEHRCLLTLQNENIAKSIKQKYKYVFVDEYQDTNDIQEAILNKICNDNNLFMVGDIKQSIYRFRECCPQIFINKYNNYTFDANKGKVIRLNENFRSDEQILNFSNFVFNNIMTSVTSCVDYKNSAKFIYGNKFITNENSSYPIVSIKLLKDEEEVKEELQSVYNLFNAPKVRPENTKIKDETKLIAQEIIKLLNNKIFDKDINAYRNIELNDIAILTRNKQGVITAIINELKNNNIPCKATFSTNVFNSLEVKLIVNYLSIINNFNNDIALTSVLSSFMYGLALEDILTIQKQGESLLKDNIEKYLLNNNDNITNVLNKLKEDIKKYKLMLNFYSLEDLVNCVILDFEFEKHCYLFNDKQERLQNIELLKNHISSCKDFSLLEYVRFVNDFAKNKESEITIGNSQNCVSIMTIHASKGLEFPVVFIINADGKFASKSSLSKLITNQDYGVALNNYDDKDNVENNSIIKNIFKVCNNFQEKQEEMRLLYVALTRAKNHLIIVGKYPKANIQKLTENFEINQASSYLQWILGCLPSIDINSINNGNNHIKIKVENNFVPLDIIENNSQQINVLNNTTSFNKKLLELDKTKYLKNDYEQNNIVLKNTVTALMNSEDNYNIKDFKYSRKKDEDNDFLLIGNMYHLVMEKINFESIQKVEDVTQFLNTLVEERKVLKNDIELVEPLKILNACKFLKEITNNDSVILKEKLFMVYMPANSLIKSSFNSKVLVQGVVDFMTNNDDEIIVVDYKTTRFNNENDFSKKYKIQLDLYAKAIEDFYGKKVTKKYIYSFYFDKAIII